MASRSVEKVNPRFIDGQMAAAPQVTGSSTYVYQSRDTGDAPMLTKK